MIDVKNIVKKYAPYNVLSLNNISFTINEGEMVAITGRSGSGKSTLMYILGCLDQPTSGSYVLDGHQVTTLNAYDLAAIRNKKIGFVFQQFNLLQDHSAIENVAFPLLYAGKSEAYAHEQAEQLLTTMNLADRMHHYPYQLSGGQQQRVALCRALINNPAIILGDEPTGNLDSTTSNEVIRLLLELNATKNMTIIVVTHDETVAQYFPRRITLLDGALVDE